MPKRILIVDDEASIRTVLAAHLRRFEHTVEVAADGAQAIARLQEVPFNAVVSDLRMPVVNGLDLLKWTQDNQPGLPVILITAHGSIDTAVEALKQGAFDYITKPFDQEELRQILGKALVNEELNAARALDPGRGHAIVGQSKAVREVYALVNKVAASPTTVLITGESGTGKELVARALHERSQRANGPFIQINCGAIPDSLFEAELFGFERGAFTGAGHSKPGRFELANGGTLFLDEVGELPPNSQVKLLRALQERTIDRVGGVAPIDVDVRVVAATNADLASDLEKGSFRSDLYYRLSVFPIHLPPLRKRPEDIPELVEHFLHQFNARLDRAVTHVDAGALAALEAHSWPGNIRELENLIERAVLLADEDTLRIEHLHGLASASQASSGDADESELGLKQVVRVHTARIERSWIAKALQEEDGNVTRAATRLGISRKSLQTKMKEYGLRDG